MVWQAFSRLMSRLSGAARTAEPIGERLVLEELRRSYDRQHAAADGLSTTLENPFVAGVVIISLAATVKVAVLRQSLGPLFWPILGLALLIYLALFVVILMGMRPLRFKHPISHDWETLAKAYFDESEQTALRQLISDYLGSMQAMHDLNRVKSRSLKLAMPLFMATVIALIAALWL